MLNNNNNDNNNNDNLLKTVAYSITRTSLSHLEAKLVINAETFSINDTHCFKMIKSKFAFKKLARLLRVILPTRSCLLT